MIDFRLIPLQRNAEAQQELLTWSDDVVEQFLPEYFPQIAFILNAMCCVLVSAYEATKTALCNSRTLLMNRKSGFLF